MTAATFEAVVEFLFIMVPLGTLEEAAWVYEGWGLGQSGSRWPKTQEQRSGYLPSWTAPASQESENSIA